MIKKPAGYDEAAAYTGESQQLPKGKYVCVIKQVATQTSKNGNKQFVILFDVAEGEQKDFFQNEWKPAYLSMLDGFFNRNLDNPIGQGPEQC